MAKNKCTFKRTQDHCVHINGKCKGETNCAYYLLIQEIEKLHKEYKNIYKRMNGTDNRVTEIFANLKRRDLIEFTLEDDLN